MKYLLILAFILLSLHSQAQYHFPDTSKTVRLYPTLFEYQETQYQPGKKLRQAGQWLAVGAAIGGVGVVKMLVGDQLHYEVMEQMGVVLTITSIPFLVVGVNKIYSAGTEMEQKEKIALLEP